ncbi:Eukaryotic translation initiation factor 5A [Entophlyctis luteolus]|nr:Eukaryotic translation initiation factor 5A [Entophlyctis luteolus]
MADHEDEHETFEAVGAGASLTYPMQCSALRKNGHVVIKGRPCKIVDSTSKTGKHGHAKVNLTAIDIFTGKKLEDVSPSTHNMEVPFVTRTEFELLDIDDDFLSLMTDSGATKDDVKMPEGDLGRDLLAAFKSERNLSVTVIKAMGEEAVIAFKDAPKHPHSTQHHFITTIHRAVRKAKSLEIRKLVRKLKAARAKVASAQPDLPEEVASTRRKELAKIERDITNLKGANLRTIVLDAVIGAIKGLGLPDPEAAKLHAVCREQTAALDSDDNQNANSQSAQSTQSTLLMSASLRVRANKEFKTKLELEFSRFASKVSDDTANVPIAVDSNTRNASSEIKIPKIPKQIGAASNGLQKPQAMPFPSRLREKKTSVIDPVQDLSTDEEMDDYSANKVTSKMTMAFVGNLNDGASDVSFSDVSDTESARNAPPPNPKGSKRSKIDTSQKKKNRPGQRARQQLWEKEFGKNANHLQKKITLHKPTPFSDIHPSWSAKQKQNQSITEFSGQKTMFWATEPTVEASVDKTLHPSWAAKKLQKQKLALISAGASAIPKKIVFGDDSGSNNANTETKSEEKLHPSWVAKKRQSATIRNSIGKKIKFDE